MSSNIAITPAFFAGLYSRFNESLVGFDCGRKCAPLNGGEPVCCSTQHAVPVMHKEEFRLLRSRSDLWRPFKAYDTSTREIVDTLIETCTTAECRGASSCERANRSLACRAFPFFPYLTREGKFIGLATYWDFEDRCWVMSNVRSVRRKFVREFVAAFEHIMRVDQDELDGFMEQSACMRRVFTRWRRPIVLIGREGGYFKVLPQTAKVAKATERDLRPRGPYASLKAYRAAVAEADAEIARQRRRGEKSKSRKAA